MSRLYLYDGTNTFTLDDKIDGVDLDMPTRSFKSKSRGANGSHVTGEGWYSGRRIKLSKTFIRRQETERISFLQTLLAPREATLWLYRVDEWVTAGITSSGSPTVTTDTDTSTYSVGDSVTGTGIPANTTIQAIVDSNTLTLDNNATATGTAGLVVTAFTGRMEVSISPSGGERYIIKNYEFSEVVDFAIYSESPFFVATTLTEESFTLSGTAEEEKTVTNSGFDAPVIVEFTPTGDMDRLRVLKGETKGFDFVTTIPGGDTLEVDASGSELAATIEDVPAANGFTTTSTPFSLGPGSNTIYIIGVAGSGKIKYYETRL